MRVLILFSSGEIGGAERSLTRMVLSSGCNIDYKLATLDGYGPWVEWCIEKDIKPLVFGVAQNGVSHGKIGIRSLLRFIAHVRKKQYDILYVVGLRASIWLRLAKPLFGDVKLVHGIRWNPNSESRLDRAFRLVEHFIGGLIDLYICNSRIARETLVHKVGISSKKIKVIYNGVDKIPVIKEDYADRPMNVVIIGNHNPRKGHLEFLESVALVLEQQPDARFFFIGRDDMGGELAAEVNRRGLEDAVTLTGYQDEVGDYLSIARVMVLPSLWNEGCPTSILEGMAYGLPVVAFAIDGIPELIDHHINGILIKPGRYFEMANAIKQLLINTEQSKVLGQAGNSKLLSCYMLKQTSDGHFKTFNELLGVKNDEEILTKTH